MEVCENKALRQELRVLGGEECEYEQKAVSRLD